MQRVIESMFLRIFEWMGFEDNIIERFENRQ
jgi:hypothetical protein